MNENSKFKLTARILAAFADPQKAFKIIDSARTDELLGSIYRPSLHTYEENLRHSFETTGNEIKKSIKKLKSA